MTRLPHKPRRTIRLPGYDYTTPGTYFITVCAYGRRLLFEDQELAKILGEEWRALADRFPSIRLDAFVVMPNHVHFVVWLTPVGVPLAGTPTASETPGEDRGAVGTGASPAPTVRIGDVVGTYKSRVAVRWLRWVQANDPARSARIWQRNYYERIIRNDAELNRIREYIIANPMLWNHDHENPMRIPDLSHDGAWSWLENHGAQP